MNTESICKLMEEINNDKAVPRNIRTAIQQAKDDLSNEKIEETIRISSVISILDDVSSDPNIPMYTRTQIWNIVSMLEVINQEVKKNVK